MPLFKFNFSPPGGSVSALVPISDDRCLCFSSISHLQVALAAGFPRGDDVLYLSEGTPENKNK